MRIALAVALLALSGCALLQKAAAPSSPAAPAVERPAFFAPSAADQIAAHAARLRGMNEKSLAAEAARHRRDGSDLGRLKAAMALALSGETEEGDILVLVDPVMKRENADPQARAMASFLHTMAVERRRLRESAAAAGTRLRDERRAHEAQKQRADSLQERAAQLQQKLDALTEIERSLSDRQVQGR